VGGQGAIVAAISVGEIPETENHRLMIESTRFLNNELVIDALTNTQECLQEPQSCLGIAPSTRSAQKAVKTWLLMHFQDIAKNDFIEYNARPYAEFSLKALQNLADFARDDEVKLGARILLEYSAAKFAVDSNQGRRFVPFRRRLGDSFPIDPFDQQSNTNQVSSRLHSRRGPIRPHHRKDRAL
jgi:hypothetical protein